MGTLNWRRKSGNILYYGDDGSITMGEFASSAAAGSGMTLDADRTKLFAAYGECTSDLTSAVMVRPVLGRMLCSGAVTSNAELFGVVGQLVAKAATLAHDNAGVLGTFESQTTAVTISGTGGDNCTAAVMGRVGVTVTATTVNATGILAGVAAMSNITSGYVTVTAGGILSAFYAGKFSSKQNWDYGLRIDEDAVTVCPIQVGEFVAAAAAGGGFAVSATNSAAMRVYSEVTADLTSAAMVRSILGRMLVTGAITSNAEVFGVVGQVVGKACTVAHDNAGVMGTFEAQTTAVTISGTGGDNCTAGVLGRVGVTITATTVNATGILAGVAAMSNITDGYVTVTTGGILAGVYVGAFASKQDWDYGIFIESTAVKCGISVGEFASAYATGSAVVMSSTVTSAARFYGESVADQTNAYNLRTLVARHLIVTASATVNHEAYGAIGQLCVKNTTLGHLHAGVMGTFEVSTAATVPTGAGVGAAGLMARLGGATITVGATGVLAGVLATQNATTVSITSGGVHAAFACRKVGSGVTWAEALHIEDALVAIRFKAADNSYAHGIKAVTDTPDTTTTHAMKVMIGTTAGYIPVYANETFGA